MRLLIISNQNTRFWASNVALAVLIYAFINSAIASSFLIDGGRREANDDAQKNRFYCPLIAKHHFSEPESHSDVLVLINNVN